MASYFYSCYDIRFAKDDIAMGYYCVNCNLTILISDIRDLTIHIIYCKSYIMPVDGYRLLDRYYPEWVRDSRDVLSDPKGYSELEPRSCKGYGGRTTWILINS